MIPNYNCLSPEQQCVINSTLESSIINAGPCTGKTTSAILIARHLSYSKKHCLYIPATSLAVTYVQNAISELHIDLYVKTYYKAIEARRHFDVIILDDSHRYSLSQIHNLSALSDYLLLFGDYSRPLSNDNDKEKPATLPELESSLSIKVYKPLTHSLVPYYHKRLIPRFSDNIIQYTNKETLPIIAKVGSIEQQCAITNSIVKERCLENVGILCYTRYMVKKVYDFFKKNKWQIEAYLPGFEGINTIKWTTKTPKVTTIASSVGIHFENVFVIGFDSGIIWKNNDEILETAVTRTNKRLYIFYEKQLAQPLDNIPTNSYSGLFKGILEL